MPLACEQTASLIYSVTLYNRPQKLYSMRYDLFKRYKKNDPYRTLRAEFYGCRNNLLPPLTLLTKILSNTLGLILKIGCVSVLKILKISQMQSMSILSYKDA
jgi:hypothetical protein